MTTCLDPTAPWLPRDLPLAALADATAFVAHIVTRYHEAHRVQLPRLRSQAAALGAHEEGLADQARALATQLAALETALEQHMFKEEMRLFPMLEQGGNSLMGLLMDDLQAEHRAQEEAVEQLDAGLRALAAPPGTTPARQALLCDAARLISDLQEHVALEDAWFEGSRASRSSSARPLL